MKAANDNRPHGAAVRFVVNPRLVPLAKAARRLHLTPAEFEAKLTAFHRHGFPLPRPLTGHYDLVAMDVWLDRMHGVSYDENRPTCPTGAASLVDARLAAIG
ncbi:hypothetical protein [Mesorhizobium sp. B2-5-7]|uniref:hypothetical protein n=1 Tax=Mesorhizobium sp. B2-5-7 TaxID=2589923 RepID=UPI00112814B6|nr:hypothetical protein [Mesorhizobium sp. B2-5-7]TPK18039.1 hypothetical protein FJ543_05995 [Mesorhizobium sp. B2-5-7]